MQVIPASLVLLYLVLCCILVLHASTINLQFFTISSTYEQSKENNTAKTHFAVQRTVRLRRSNTEVFSLQRKPLPWTVEYMPEPQLYLYHSVSDWYTPGGNKLKRKILNDSQNRLYILNLYRGKCPNCNRSTRKKRQSSRKDIMEKITNANVEVDTFDSNITILELLNVSSGSSIVEIKEQRLHARVLCQYFTMHLDPEFKRYNMSIKKHNTQVNITNTNRFNLTADESVIIVEAVDQTNDEHVNVTITSLQSQLSFFTGSSVIDVTDAESSLVFIDTLNTTDSERLIIESLVDQSNGYKRNLTINMLTRNASVVVTLEQALVTIKYNEIEIFISKDHGKILMITDKYNITVSTVLTPYLITLTDGVSIQSGETSLTINRGSSDVHVHSNESYMSIVPDPDSTLTMANNKGQPVMSSMLDMANTKVEVHASQLNMNISSAHETIIANSLNSATLIKTDVTDVGIKSNKSRIEIQSGSPWINIFSYNVSVEIRKGVSGGGNETEVSKGTNTNKPIPTTASGTISTSRISLSQGFTTKESTMNFSRATSSSSALSSTRLVLSSGTSTSTSTETSTEGAITDTTPTATSRSSSSSIYTISNTVSTNATSLIASSSSSGHTESTTRSISPASTSATETQSVSATIASTSKQPEVTVTIGSVPSTSGSSNITRVSTTIGSTGSSINTRSSTGSSFTTKSSSSTSAVASGSTVKLSSTISAIGPVVNRSTTTDDFIIGQFGNASGSLLQKLSDLRGERVHLRKDPMEVTHDFIPSSSLSNILDVVWKPAKLHQLDEEININFDLNSNPAKPENIKTIQTKEKDEDERPPLNIHPTTRPRRTIVGLQNQDYSNSSLLVPLDGLLSVTVNTPFNVDIQSNTFSEIIRIGLLESYLQARQKQLFSDQNIRSRRNRKRSDVEQAQGLQLNISFIGRITPELTNVHFYLTKNGLQIKAKQAADTYSVLSSEELSAIISYPVAEIPSPLYENENLMKAGISSTTLVGICLLTGAIITLIIITLVVIFRARERNLHLGKDWFESPVMPPISYGFYRKRRVEQYLKTGNTIAHPGSDPKCDENLHEVIDAKKILDFIKEDLKDLETPRYCTMQDTYQPVCSITGEHAPVDIGQCGKNGDCPHSKPRPFS